jgi:hypothetical protein
MFGIKPFVDASRSSRVQQAVNVYSGARNPVLMQVPKEAEKYVNNAMGNYHPSKVVTPHGLDRGNAIPLDVTFNEVPAINSDDGAAIGTWGIELDVKDFKPPQARVLAATRKGAFKYDCTRVVYGTKNGTVRVARNVGHMLSRVGDEIGVVVGEQLTREIDIGASPEYAKIFARSMDEERMQSARVMASAFQNAQAVQGLEDVTRHGIGLLEVPVEATRYVARLAIMYVETSLHNMDRTGSTVWNMNNPARVHVCDDWTTFRRLLAADMVVGPNNYVPWGTYSANPIPMEQEHVRFLRAAAAETVTFEHGQALITPMCWPVIQNLAVVTTLRLNGANNPDARGAFTAEVAYNAGRSWAARYATTEMYDEMVDFFMTMYWGIKGSNVSYAVPFNHREIALPVAEMQGYIMVPYLETDSMRAMQAADYSSAKYIDQVSTSVSKAAVIGMCVAWIKHRHVDYMLYTGTMKRNDMPDFMTFLQREGEYCPLWSMVQGCLESLGYRGSVGLILSTMCCTLVDEGYAQALLSGAMFRNTGDYLGWLPFIPSGSAAEGWVQPTCLEDAGVEVGHLATVVDVSNKIQKDPIPTILETSGVEMLTQLQVRKRSMLTGRPSWMPSRTKSGFVMDRPYMALTDSEGSRTRFAFRVNIDGWSALTHRDHDRYKLKWWVMLGCNGKMPNIKRIHGLIEPRTEGKSNSSKNMRPMMSDVDMQIDPAAKTTQIRIREIGGTSDRHITRVKRVQNAAQMMRKTLTAVKTKPTENKGKTMLAGSKTRTIKKEDMTRLKAIKPTKLQAYVREVPEVGQKETIAVQPIKARKLTPREEMQLELERMREMTPAQRVEVVCENHPEGESDEENVPTSERLNVEDFVPSQMSAEGGKSFNPFRERMTAMLEVHENRARQLRERVFAEKYQPAVSFVTESRFVERTDNSVQNSGDIKKRNALEEMMALRTQRFGDVTEAEQSIPVVAPKAKTRPIEIEDKKVNASEKMMARQTKMAESQDTVTNVPIVQERPRVHREEEENKNYKSMSIKDRISVENYLNMEVMAVQYLDLINEEILFKAGLWTVATMHLDMREMYLTETIAVLAQATLEKEGLVIPPEEIVGELIMRRDDYKTIEAKIALAATTRLYREIMDVVETGRLKEAIIAIRSQSDVRAMMTEKMKRKWSVTKSEDDDREWQDNLREPTINEDVPMDRIKEARDRLDTIREAMSNREIAISWNREFRLTNSIKRDMIYWELNLMFNAYARDMEVFEGEWPEEYAYYGYITLAEEVKNKKETNGNVTLFGEKKINKTRNQDSSTDRDQYN